MNPKTVAVMNEAGIDISNHTPRLAGMYYVDFQSVPLTEKRCTITFLYLSKFTGTSLIDEWGYTTSKQTLIP